MQRADALLGRKPLHQGEHLLHHAHPVATKGDSHRLAEALAGKGVKTTELTRGIDITEIVERTSFAKQNNTSCQLGACGGEDRIGGKA